MTQQAYCALLLTINDHARSWHWGAIAACDAYLLFQAERDNWWRLGAWYTEAEMEAWADRVNAFLFATKAAI